MIIGVQIASTLIRSVRELVRIEMALEIQLMTEQNTGGWHSIAHVSQLLLVMAVLPDATAAVGGVDW